MEENETESIKANIKFARESARRIIKGAHIPNPPIDLKTIIAYLSDQNQDIALHSWDFEDSVSGIQIADSSNSCTIGYNENHHVHRQRFTISHEIGHFILGHTKEIDPEKFKPTDVQETEASEFAAELLMPLSHVKKALKDGLTSIDVLAKHFWVSKDALTMRIMKLGLLKSLSK